MIWIQQNGEWKPCPLHNSMAGMVAFIVCNGPSLAKIDASTMNGPGRVVIAVNNAVPMVRPDWWVGMDTPDCYERSIFGEAYPKLIRSTYRDKFDGLPSIYTADMMENVAFYDGGERDAFRWDSDTFRIAIQFALYLGCQDIVLAGVDLSVKRGDYAGGNILTEGQRESNQRLYDRSFDFLRWHIKARRNVKFNSVSPGGRINEIMPYHPLKRVLKTINRHIPRGRKRPHCST